MTKNKNYAENIFCVLKLKFYYHCKKTHISSQ